MKIIGVIPARYQSSRLPGKPLADICGRPMVWWVYQRVREAKKLDEIYVATDDARILDTCQHFHIPAVMTANTHPTGANRLQEVSDRIKGDFYVQLNGDEPLINVRAIDAVIPSEIPQDVEFGTNIITEISDPVQVFDASNIKVAFDCHMNALYMSRTPIPYPFKSVRFKYYKHVGIIGYNKKMLDFYNNSAPGRFETIEGIDTLRFIDYGKRLLLVDVPECHSLSVDTPMDLEAVRKRMEELQNGK